MGKTAFGGTSEAHHVCLMLVVPVCLNRRRCVMRCHLKNIFLLAAGLLILTRVYIYTRKAESGSLKVLVCALLLSIET